MQNEMRDRLTASIENAKKLYEGDVTDLTETEYVAECLLSEGIIVPPCKVGDIVWVDDFMWGLIPCKVDRPYHCICGENGSCTFERGFTDDDIGKTVFLTKEEAEQKLKGGADNG
jgi:hypothetical protein